MKISLWLKINHLKALEIEIFWSEKKLDKKHKKYNKHNKPYDNLIN